MRENAKNGNLQKMNSKKQREDQKENQKKSSEVPCYIAMGVGAGLAFLFLFLSYFSKGESLWISILGFNFILFLVYSFAAASHICGAGLEKYYVVLLIESFLIIAVVGYIYLSKNIYGYGNQPVTTLIFSLGGTIIGALAASIKDVLNIIKAKYQAQKRD